MWYTDASKSGNLPDVDYPSPPKYSEIATDHLSKDVATGPAGWKAHSSTTAQEAAPRPAKTVPQTPPAPPIGDDLSWGTLIYNYSQNTTLHGVRYMTEKSVFVSRRIVWFFMVSASLSFFAYYSYNRFSFFFQYKKTINVQVEYKSKVRFPAVTFCNQNAFRITAVADRGWYSTVKELSNTTATNTKMRQCNNATEFECVSDHSCISLSRRCDIFPDCLDNSDETNCGSCPILAFRADSLNGLPDRIADIVDKRLKFEHQPTTFSDGVHVYITREKEYVYLYRQDGYWHVANRHGSSEPWMRIRHPATLPQDIYTPGDAVTSDAWDTWQHRVSGTWRDDTTNFRVECEHAFLDLLKEDNVTMLTDLSLEELYNVSSHQEEDFIQSCKWKGEDCRPGSIQQIHTDMGICYKFHTEDVIELSGPGNGLTMTMNIEQYEYTKSTEDGIGIKLLMHGLDDVPIMSAKGQSISPGLFSFISIETTTVETLHPPWGECGEKKLDYYDKYTLTRCTANCETNFLAKHCNCRDLSMPQRNGEPVVCNVHQFLDCAKFKLDQMRAAGNHCKECPSPCSTDEYVPTTSFSVILGGEGNFQDEKTFALQNRLRKAREVGYRVVKQSYMGTMRVFHILNQQMLYMRKFINYVTDQLHDEYDNVTTHALQVKADCVEIRTTSYEARSVVQKSILLPLQDFKSILLTRTKDAFSELETLLDDTVNVIQAAIDGYGDSWPLHMQNDPMHIDYMRDFDTYVNETIQRNNLTIWQTTTRLLSSLNQIQDEIHANLSASLNALDTSSFQRFTINKTLFDPIRTDIGKHCDWCVKLPPEPVFDILKRRVLENVGTDIHDKLVEVISDVQSALNTYLNYQWLKLFWRWNFYPIQKETFVNFRDRIQSGYTNIQSTIWKVQSAIDDTEEVLLLIDDLVSYAWGLQCQTKLPKLLNEYNGNQVVSSEMLDSMYKYVEEQDVNVYYDLTNYTSKSKTLEAVGSSIKFDEISNNVHGLKLRLDSSINDRTLLLADIEKQINQIYYVIMAQSGGTTTLSSTSDYWQTFKIKTPDAKLPTPKSINGVPLPLLDYTMLTDGNDARYWNELESILKVYQDYLQKQLDELDVALSTASSYFADYIAGNQINTDFYSKNFLNVELFYKELTENTVSQQPAYEYQNLLSELGGLLGLLLGASVLTFGEIADLFIYNAFRRYFRSKDAKSNKVGGT